MPFFSVFLWCFFRPSNLSGSPRSCLPASDCRGYLHDELSRSTNRVSMSGRCIANDSDSPPPFSSQRELSRHTALLYPLAHSACSGLLSRHWFVSMARPCVCRSALPVTRLADTRTRLTPFRYGRAIGLRSVARPPPTYTSAAHTRSH